LAIWLRQRPPAVFHFSFIFLEGGGVSQLHKQINKLRGKQVGATENETDSESLEESVEESESESEEESVELWELKAETKTEIAGATDDKRRKVQNSSCK